MRSLLALFATAAAVAAAPIPGALRSSVTLHASFDKGLQADTARGDRQIYHAPDYKRQKEAQPGLGDVDAALEPRIGVGGGGAVRFRSKNTRALFFRGDRHVTLAAGTISFWLRLDPQQDLAPGYTDPIQITDKAYNDSGIWVDFTRDDVPRQFRLGVFGSLKAWNPNNTPSDKNPDFIPRLVAVQRPPFTREQWTHVVATWSGLNAANGSASLFLNGKLIGTREIRESFQWDSSMLAIRLGVNYSGLMDEVAAFDRALTPAEVASLYAAGAKPAR
jgi:hypothetical protein